MFRRLLLVFLALIVVLVVVVDRVGANVAGHVLAGKLESDEHLTSRPSVDIKGIPFLTQAFGGKYGEVDVTAHGFKTRDGVVVTTLGADLHGVHIPFSKVVGGSVSRVPVDRVNGRAFVSFGNIARYLAGSGVSVTLNRAGPGSVNVTGQLTRHSKLVRGVARVGASQSSITLSLTVGGVTAKVLAIPLRALPFRFAVTSVKVGANGISGTGVARDVVLGS